MKFDWSIVATMAVCVSLGIAGGMSMHFKGAELAIFIALLALVGVAAAAAIAYFKNRPDKAAAAKAAMGGGAPAAGGDSEIDTLVRDADRRLAQANAGATIANLPLIFVIGDRSTAKTSTVVNCGIEPELLAGQIYQDNLIAPTRAVNLWFARGAALVEAGGGILGDPGNWLRLVKRLQPGKLKSLKGGAQSPRAVLLCVSLEAFTQGGPDAIATAARYLQARLAEVAQTLGIRFPVYILFTKTDRVPFFIEFVGTFNNDEASQVFGATVPMRPAKETGVYAEEETRRLTAYFDNLFFSLCDKRTVFPPRDNDLEKVCGAYEYPREMRKVREAIVRFMVDVCRPSQLTTSPFLRGFYFSGVRPVLVSDAAPIAASRPPQADFHNATSTGATGMFRVGKQAEMVAQQSIAQPVAASRKVPQWMFLGHLFNNIILSDSAAMSASGSSVKVSALRRGLLIAASVICLILAGIFTFSFYGNHSIETTARKAADSIDTKDLPAGKSPTLDNLQQLDTLRQTLETLDEYEADGAPYHLRWGLYPGTDLHDAVHDLYFKRFHALLFGQTQAGLLKVMQGVKAPAGEADDWFRPYETLKAYLLTTGKYNREGQSDDPTPLARTTKKNIEEKVLPAFLSKLLFDRWSENRDPKDLKDLSDLAKLQFDYYANVLGRGNPFPSEKRNDPLIAQSRDYLNSFKGPKRLYYGMLNDAKKQKPAQSFNQYSPGSAATLESPRPVIYPFTQKGSTYMLDKINSAKFNTEAWVLPDAGRTVDDVVQMKKDILSLYTKDYIDEWRTVLKTSHVVHYKDPADAVVKLDTLTTDAPLLRVISWSSENTSVTAMPDVTNAFKAVHDAEPPDAETNGWVKPQNVYNEALAKLQTAVKAAVEAKLEPTTLKAAQDAADNATAVTKGIFTQLSPDLDGKMNSVVGQLMLEPIIDAKRVLLPPSPFIELNKQGAGLCSSLGPITKKFPFNSTATPEATLDEIASIFNPTDGKLWALYKGGLNKVIQCTPSGDCTQVENAGGKVDPQFLTFFKQAIKFSRALYGESGTTPNFHYSLKPQKSDQVASFDLTVNGEPVKLEGGSQKSFIWPGQKQNFKVDLEMASGGILEGDLREGLWAAFRFFADADKTVPNGSGYDFFWSIRQGRENKIIKVNGHDLIYTFTFEANGAPAIFSKEFLAGMKCVPTVGK